ncbi:oligosaccharide flippase family protein [Cytobacillus sp. FJAT-54145]|uniref:Oligosaccharide flippase family protein n=1 Tax=Cytobacillus spartinae TaxID=3299023 RepID=A0ABW6KMH9_9BACI
MKPEHHSKDLLKGAFILSIAAIITKILSAVYRVPFQNIVGDVGFYIYQQVYPFYGIALVLSTYGFPLIISKLYAERESQNDQLAKERLLIVSTLFISSIGVLSFIALYMGSTWLANYMGDPELSMLLKVIAIVFLIFPIVSVIRGYFQGLGEMVPTAVSQVGEQAVRVGTILIAATLLMREGYNLYIVGAGAVLGSVTGGLVSTFILITFFWIWRRKKGFLPLRKYMDIKDCKVIVKALVVQGFAICVSSLLLIFLQLADSLNLYSLLISEGLNSEDAKELKGIYDRGQPLIQLGTVVATSIALSLVPLISSRRVINNSVLLHEKINIALRISIMIGVGATVGLLAIIKPTNIMLFKNTNGNEVLSLLCFIIVLSSIIITVTAVLQGLGNTLFPAIVILFGFGIKYILNIILVPNFSTLGAALASIVSLLFILAVIYMKLRAIVRKRIVHIKFLLIVLAASITMFIGVKGFLFTTNMIFHLGNDRILASLQAVSAVIIGGFIYLFMMIKSNVFKEEELVLLPFGSKLMMLLPRKNRR